MTEESKQAEPKQEIDALTLFQSDTAKEEQGAWVWFGKTGFCIRSLNAPEVQSIYERQRKRQSKIRQANDGMLPPAMVEMNDVEVCAALVTDWQGMPNPDRRDEMLHYSAETAKRILARKDLRNLRAAIFAEAASQANFRAQRVEELEGNSPAPSAPVSESGAAAT